VLVAASVAMPLILLTHSRQLSLSALDCLKCCWPIQVVADPYSEEDDDSSFSLCRSRSSRLPQECIKHDFPFACLPRCDLLACILVVQLASTFYHKSNWIDIANCRRGERIYLQPFAKRLALPNAESKHMNINPRLALCHFSTLKCPRNLFRPFIT